MNFQIPEARTSGAGRPTGDSDGGGGVRFTVRQRKTIIAKDTEVRNAMLTRHKTKIIIDGQDVTPKNLGDVNLDDLLEDLDIDMDAASEWGQKGNAAKRQTFFGAMVTRAQFGPAESGAAAAGASDEQAGGGATDMEVILSQMDNINVVRTEASLRSRGDRAQSTTSILQSGVSMPSSTDDETTSRFSMRESIGSTAGEASEVAAVPLPTHIKINVRETEDIDLFAANSQTVPADSAEAAAVLADNEQYDYLTLGKGRARRTSEAEAQTQQTLYKTRAANTERVRQACAGTYVSNFEMYDTYAELEAHTRTLETDAAENGQLAVTTYKHTGAEGEDEMLFAKSDNFKLSSMIIQRMLAGNTFRLNQQRFRNMVRPDPLDLDFTYRYRVEELWTYELVGHVGNAVSGMSWCRANGDLLAVGYGVFGFQLAEMRTSGYVCVWSIKNPKHPERMYRFPCPVTAVQFSRSRPQLLAIAMYNGCIEVVDISDDSAEPVARSHRDTSPGVEPVWVIKWIQPGTKPEDEQMMTVSQDGLVMKYQMPTNGPWLLGQRHILLDRIVGDVEGLRVPTAMKLPIEANRHPQAFVLAVDPVKGDMFYVGTDEGCVHRCSTFYPQQYLGIMRVANGSVAVMEFSPWSPKIFLTCGSDWKVRLWVDEVFEPVMELGCVYEAIRWAAWSPVNSTILVCLTMTEVQLWNIRKNVIRPVSQTKWRSGNVALTKCVFSRCGRSLVVGDAEGKAHVCALEDMPFDPHYQLEELEAAIMQGLLTKPDLSAQVKSMGYLGYPKGEKMGMR